jgi:uncharacterized protein YjiK
MTEPFAASSTRPARRLRPRAIVTALAMALVALLVVAAASASAAVTEVNLAQYKRIHRFALPLPPGTPAPANSLLAEEASGVTYDPDTGTLFIVGDGGTSVVQVDKEGNYIDSMTLAPAAFEDTEGIAYVGPGDGEGEFVITEERKSKLDRFKYVAEGELTRADVQTVVIGDDNDNIGLEGVTNDPLNANHMIAVKESGPERIYSTDIDWDAETATNFEASEGELFPAADVGTLDFSDVYALANVPGISAAEESNLLIISQESGEVVNISRSGTVHSRLALLADPTDTISVPDMTNEGVTMDQNGMLYVVDENGGGTAAHPQLWVYEPQTTADAPPTAVTLGSQTNSLPESTTGARVKLATVTVTDPDGFGENNLSVTGPDASHFEVDHNGLYLKAGTVLNASAQAEYEVSVEVDDPTSPVSPDATSAPYKLTVTPNSGGTSAAQVAITEVAPWSSKQSPFEEDWFELTNIGTTKVDLTGWRMNDNHSSFASAVQLHGVSSLAPGQSAVFVEGDEAGDVSVGEAKEAELIADWFPSGAPAGFQIGWLSEVGLSTDGDQVNIYDSTGAKVSGVAFGASPGAAPFGTFDNTAALGVGATTDPAISTLSTVGPNEAFSTNGGNEIGSPGTAPVKTPVAVTEVAPWGSSWPEYEADWFELTNESSVPVSLSGWKMDDSSNEFSKAVPLVGIATLAPGESAIFVELKTTETTEQKANKVNAFKASWFGSAFPAGLQVGTYEGSGVGLSTGGDGVNIFNTEGAHLSGVAFGVNEGTETAEVLTAAETFDNHAGVGSFNGTPPTITEQSVEGQFGARDAHDQIGSPGTTEAPAPPVLPEVKITEVDPTSNGGPVGGDWFELSNEGAAAVDLTGWKADDDSDSFAEGGALTGVPSLPAGASAVFVEKTSQEATFEATWFPNGLPTGFLLGSYQGPGLGSGGDQVNVFDAAEEKVTGVAFGQSTNGVSFDNIAGAGDATSTPPPTISVLSVAGANGAFTNEAGETASPGTLSGFPSPTLSADTPTFPTQAVGTIGPGQWITITNTGFVPAAVISVKVVEDDEASAGDFILGSEGCAGRVLFAGKSCKVQVRFAPGRENAASSAHLVVGSTASNSTLEVPLAGTSGSLPKGETGEQGEVGPTGPSGPSGPTGPSGPQGGTGEPGAQGATGPAGSQGEKGATGPAGPTGPQGPAGTNGKNGKDGKDGVVEFVASGSTAQARRGHVAHLQFRIKNKTAGVLRGAKVSADSLAKGTDSVAVDTIKAGHSGTVTLDLQVGRNASLGRHRIKVELKAGGHTVTQTVVVKVTR